MESTKHSLLLSQLASTQFPQSSTQQVSYEEAEVIATSESTLNEVSLKPPSPGKNSPDSVLKQTELLENPKSDNLKKYQETNQSVQKNGDPKKKTCRFSCEMGQVGTLSQKVMNKHEKGKKRLRRLEKRMQKGETGESNQMEKFEVPVNSIDHVSDSGKSIHSRNVNLVMDEARLEPRNPSDASANGFETSTVQIRAADSRVSEVVPLTKNGNEEETIIFVANPDATIFGSKSKAEIIATSESALNEDFLLPQSLEKHFSIGKHAADTVLLKQTELLEKPKPGKLRNDQEKIIQNVQTNGDPKKTMYSFWCEICQIGTPSEIDMNGHEKGKKHLRLLKEKEQTDDTEVDNQEKIEVPVNCVEHVSESGKSIPSCNVDVVSAEARLELPKPSDTSENGFETFLMQTGTADLRASEVKPAAEKGRKEDIILEVSPNANVPGSKWKAVTPPPAADTSKSALKDMCEKKYKLKEDSLKPQSPGKHSVKGKVPRDILLLKKPELLVNLKSDNFKKDQAKTIQSVQKNNDPKKTKERFWCEKYQVGTSSDKVVNDVEKGKTHKEIVQIGETGSCQHKEKIDEPVNRAKHVSEGGKIIFSHILTKQDAKAASADIIKSGDSSTLLAFSPKDGQINAKREWNCALCQVLAPNKSSLNEHLCGKKHKRKEASLKAQRPRNNSSITYNIEKEKESTQNDESGSCNHKEEMEVPVHCVEYVSDLEKNIFSEFFGVVVGQARLELPKPLDASNNGSHGRRVNKQNKKDGKSKR